MTPHDRTSPRPGDAGPHLAPGSRGEVLAAFVTSRVILRTELTDRIEDDLGTGGPDPSREPSPP